MVAVGSKPVSSVLQKVAVFIAVLSGLFSLISTLVVVYAYRTQPFTGHVAPGQEAGVPEGHDFVSLIMSAISFKDIINGLIATAIASIAALLFNWLRKKR